MLAGMYGTKGGNAEERRYPTVSNVKEEFYKTHEPCDDPDAGHVQLVGDTLFRFDGAGPARKRAACATYPQAASRCARDSSA